jgi:CIC family chloride channel protein
VPRTARFTALNATAVAMGAVAGMAAVLLRYAISWVQNAAFTGELHLRNATALEEGKYFVGNWGALVVLVPLAGGMIVGLIRHFRPETKQFGVSEVMAAVQAQGGILRGRSSWGHTAISAITVGTGGSTGREGPIGYIGAALGSSLGRRLGFSARDIKILLGCGFAAGIAASFNAPLGGVLMAIELVVPEFSTHAFIPLVAASVTGVAVGHIFLGSWATFPTPVFNLTSPWELFVYLVLGLVCGMAAVGFIRLVTWSYRAWIGLQFPEIVKPAAGGLLVGVLGLAMFSWFGNYHVFGTGYATISHIVSAPSGGFLSLIPLLLVLAIAKPLATSITVGSGGGGGMFSVSLYQGAVLGGLVGFAGHALIPGIVADPAAYAIVGMGAFYAASARATLTAIVIVTELVGNYAILLPLMLAAVVADAVSVRLSLESIYTVRLAEKGIHYEHARIQNPLDFVHVKDVMTPKVDVLPSTMTVGEAFNRMADLGHTGYPVLDAEGNLAGIVTRRDLSRHLQGGQGSQALAGVVSGLAITCTPDERLHRARDRMHRHAIGRLVVVDEANRRKVLGILTRSDVLRAEAEKDIEGEDAGS